MAQSHSRGNSLGRVLATLEEIRSDECWPLAHSPTVITHITKEEIKGRAFHVTIRDDSGSVIHMFAVVALDSFKGEPKFQMFARGKFIADAGDERFQCELKDVVSARSTCGCAYKIFAMELKDCVAMLETVSIQEAFAAPEHNSFSDLFTWRTFPAAVFEDFKKLIVPTEVDIFPEVIDTAKRRNVTKSKKTGIEELDVDKDTLSKTIQEMKDEVMRKYHRRIAAAQKVCMGVKGGASRKRIEKIRMAEEDINAADDPSDNSENEGDVFDDNEKAWFQKRGHDVTGKKKIEADKKKPAKPVEPPPPMPPPAEPPQQIPPPAEDPAPAPIHDVNAPPPMPPQVVHPRQYSGRGRRGDNFHAEFGPPGCTHNIMKLKKSGGTVFAGLSAHCLQHNNATDWKPSHQCTADVHFSDEADIPHFERCLKRWLVYGRTSMPNDAVARDRHMGLTKEYSKTKARFQTASLPDDIRERAKNVFGFTDMDLHGL